MNKPANRKRRGWVGFRIDGFRKSARIVDFCGKSSGLADFENTVARGSAVIFDADSGLCLPLFGSWVLNEIWIIDLSSARNVTEFIQIIFFFERSSFKLRFEIIIGIVLCYCHHSMLPSLHLGKINIGIHVCQFTFEPTFYTCFYSLVADGGIWRKKGTDRRIWIPLFTPLKKGLCVSSRRTWKTETLFSLSCFSLQLIIITFSSISSISSSRVHVKLTALPLFLGCAKQRIDAFVHARFLTNLDLTKYIQCIYQRTGIAPAMLKLHTEVQNSPSYFWAVKT